VEEKSPKDKVVSTQSDDLNRNSSKKVITVPTLQNIKALNNPEELEESMHPRTASLLTEELLKPLEPNSMFTSMSGMTSAMQPSELASFQKDGNLFSRISQSFTFSSTQLPQSVADIPTPLMTPSLDSPYSNFSASKFEEIDAALEKYYKSPTKKDFLDDSTLYSFRRPSSPSTRAVASEQFSQGSKTNIFALDSKKVSLGYDPASDKMSRSTLSVRTPAPNRGSTPSNLLAPNPSDSFDFDPIRVSPTYQKRVSTAHSELFDYDPRLTVYDNGSRPRETPEKNNLFAQSQPISIPSSAKPRTSVELSSSTSQIHSMDTAELFQPLKPISDLFGNASSTEYNSSINTNELMGSKLVDSLEIDEMLKHVELMDPSMAKEEAKFLTSQDRMFSGMNPNSFKSSADRPLMDLSVSFDSIQDIDLPPPSEYVAKAIDPMKEHLDQKIHELEQFEKDFDFCLSISSDTPKKADRAFAGSFNSSAEETFRADISSSPQLSTVNQTGSDLLKSSLDVKKDRLKLLKTKSSMGTSI